MTAPTPPSGDLTAIPRQNQQPFDESGAQDALTQISTMLSGTKVLQNEPGLVYSLAQQQAHPADAQAIDQFLQSLEAEKRVALARATSEKITLSDNEKTMLDATGVKYSDVEFTQQDAAQTAAKNIFDQTNGQFTAKTNPDGTLALDANGNIQRVPVHQAVQQHGGNEGVLGHIAGFFEGVGHYLKRGVGDALSGMNKGWNFVQAAMHNPVTPTLSQVVNNPSGYLKNPVDTTGAQDMEAQGYQPGSLWSLLAFDASGKAHTNLSDLNDKYGTDKVDEALQFLNDPEKFKQNLFNDPTSWTTDQSGRPALTAEAQAKLQYFGSHQFENLARRINAHSANVGTDFANTLGIDPVKHSKLYGLTAAASNFIAGFVVDPTLAAFKVGQEIKLAQVGIDGLADGPRAAAILKGNGFYAKQVQRGWQRGIDLGKQFREAETDAQRAAITAQFRAELPGLEPIMDNFTGGEHVFQGFHPEETEIVNGKVMPKAIFGHSNGFQNLDDAAQFVDQQWGLTRLMNGRAATQSGLMPGALSALGYRKLKGLTAGLMTSRSAARAEKAATEVITRAQADPALAKSLLDDKIIRPMQPAEDDAVVFHDGSVLAEKPTGVAEGGMPSQYRGAKYELTEKGVGAVKQNLRATGDVLGDSTLGRFSPTAIKERLLQAGIRLSTLLPRNTLIDINDARSGDTLYRTALTFLNRGEANTLRAAWNTADAGGRKLIVHGLIDQLAHAAGLAKTETGRELMARLKTDQEAYFAHDGGEIVVNGEHVAGFEGQTRTQWPLPSFQEMSKAANRLGLYAPTLGRAATVQQADTIMSLWKFGALFKPSTVTRNMLEGWLRTMLEGRAGDALKARAVATMKNRELWDRGFGTEARDSYIDTRGTVDTLTSELAGGGLPRALRAEKTAQLRQAKSAMTELEKQPIVQHLLAEEAGNADRMREIENANMLSGNILGRSRFTERLAQAAPLVLVGRAYRELVGRHMDEETLNALLTYGSTDLQLAMEGYGLQLMEAELGFRNAAKQATETAEAGFGPARLRWTWKRLRSRHEGAPTAEDQDASGAPVGTQWTHRALDSTTGAERYANALAQRVNAMPETARAAIKLVRMGNTDPERGRALNDLVKALEGESEHTMFGRVYFPDINESPTQARLAATPEEAEVGKYDWANKVAQEYRYLLTGQNGQFQEDLAKFIEDNGVAPDGNWIVDHLTRDNRPESALAPTVMAMVPGGPSKLAEALQDIEGTAYSFIVERPLQRLTSAPVFLANYAIARRQLNPMVERLVENGMKQEAAENLAKDLATRQSWVKTEQLIDDPGQKTQFDVVARNFFPFARATQAMIRRWATGLWQNPAAARKMMLAYEGAVHSGLIYNNVYGEPTFTYPGSGVMNEAMRTLALVPGFENFARFPVAADMTGQVLMSVPGADNPFRMSMGPMIAVPFRELYTGLLPYLHAHLGVPTANTQEQLARIDSLINGPIGQGETWVQFVPTVVRKFYTALAGDQRNSALASAMNGAIANLAAAGLLPAPDASSSEKQAFLGRLQTQVKSQLFLRAVFGLFAPAAPSSPSEGTSASGADYAWDIEGIQQLSDEYKSILNEVNGDVARANVIFTTLHPDQVVYDPKGDLQTKYLATSGMETTRSGSVTPGAYLPSTQSALDWLDRNADFVRKYSSVAAYFLPTGSSNEPFSDAAYKAQLEFGLRQRKTPAEFMKDIYTKHAESVFFPADQALNQEIAQARLNGDTALEQQLTQGRHDWEQWFKAKNPYFADKLDDYGTARKTARAQLSDLQEMVKNGEVPDGYGPQLSTLIQTYNSYQDFLNAHQGSSAADKMAKDHALAVFNQWAADTLSGTPLADVFNGVFRVLNSNLSKINDGTTG